MSPRNKLMLFVIEMDQLIGHNHTFLSDHAYEHENQTHRLLTMLNWSQGLTRTTPLWMIPPNTGSANKFWRPNNTSTVFWMQIWLQLSKPWHFSICRKKKKFPFGSTVNLKKPDKNMAKKYFTTKFALLLFSWQNRKC